MKVIISQKDVAGMNILKFLGNVDVEVVEQDIIYCKPGSTGPLIFASRHKAESGRPSLTVHTTGNFGDAMYGGEKKTLSCCNALLMAEAVRKLNELNDLEEFEVILECTHHGPTLNQEVLFIEVGSKESDWRNLRACGIVAGVVKYLLNCEPEKTPVAIGFGGQHYPKKFTQLALEKEYAFGHICPKYNIERLNKNLVTQMIEKTKPKPDFALIDRKSLKGSQRDFVKGLLKRKINVKEI